MRRKKISKTTRQYVYEKYGGRCAYCGCEMILREMQVDHIESVYAAEYKGKQVNDTIENYMPACRACNFYKGASSLEVFRGMVATLHERLGKQFIYRLAKKYGMVEEKPMVNFYFEEVEEDEQK